MKKKILFLIILAVTFLLPILTFMNVPLKAANPGWTTLNPYCWSEKWDGVTTYTCQGTVCTYSGTTYEGTAPYMYEVSYAIYNVSFKSDLDGSIVSYTVSYTNSAASISGVTTGWTVGVAELASAGTKLYKIKNKQELQPASYFAPNNTYVDNSIKPTIRRWWVGEDIYYLTEMSTTGINYGGYDWLEIYAPNSQCDIAGNYSTGHPNTAFDSQKGYFVIADSTAGLVGVHSGKVTFQRGGVTGSTPRITSNAPTISGYFCYGYIDQTPPTGSHTLSTSDWTNGSVTINVTGTDEGTGMMKIVKPSGTIVTAPLSRDKTFSTSYIVNSNGKYTFQLWDNMSEINSYDVNISNIDNTAPTATYTLNPAAWTNGSVTINITATDTDSGVKSVTLPDGMVINSATANYSVTENNDYVFLVEDNAGNTKNVIATVSNIDKTPATTNYTLSDDDWTADDVTITATFTDNESGIKSITKPDNTVETAPTDSHTFSVSYTVSENGSFSFSCENNAGLTSNCDAVVAIIDKAAPNLILSADILTATSSDVVITATATDNQSGVKSIALPDGTIVTAPAGSHTFSTTYTVSKNDSYSFTATDNCNLATAESIDIGNIDKTHATSSYTLSADDWTADDVTITATFTDNESGIKSITKPDNTVETAPTDSHTFSVSYTVSENGSFSFSCENNAGLTSNCDAVVAVIDKMAPTGSHALNPDGEATEIEIAITATDNESGIKSITLPDDTVVNNATASYAVTENDSYSFEIENNAGIKTTYIVVVSNIQDPTPPEAPSGSDSQDSGADTASISSFSLEPKAASTKNVGTSSSPSFFSYSLSTTDWTKNNVTISFSGSGIITLPDGSSASGDGSYTVSTNGNYTFTLEDGTVINVIVNNIEKTPPTKPVIAVLNNSSNNWRSANEIDDIMSDMVKSDAISGIAKVQYKITNITGEVIKTVLKTALPKIKLLTSESSYSIETVSWTDFDKNQKLKIAHEGVFEVEVRTISNAGNISDVTEYMIYNDFTPPVLTAEMVTDNIMRITATDELSGIKSITLPDGEKITATSVDLDIKDFKGQTVIQFTAEDGAKNIHTLTYNVSMGVKTVFENNVLILMVLGGALLFAAVIIVVMFARRRR